jgi:restriction endonuclease S subunit
MKEGWKHVKFSEVFNLQMGKTPSRDNLAYWGGDNVWVSIADLKEKCIESTKEHITDLAVSESGIHRVPKGTAIMSFKLTIGRAAITKCDLFTNEAIMSFEPKEKNTLIPDYIYYYLKGCKWSGANKAVMGQTLNKKTISENIFAYPSLETQSHIVSELDLLQSIIDKQQAQLKELDNLAQSIFYDMFGDPVENEKGWEVKKLGELCDVYRGGSPRPIEQYLGGTIPWIKIGDATKGDDIYLHQTKEHIIEEGLKKTRFIHAGSLIFANCGVSLGFARIITFDGCIHDGWLAFDNISNSIEKVFLLKSLNFCTSYFRNIAPDGTQPNLNTGIMKSFEQILPPLSMQKQFIEKVESIEKQKTAIGKSIEETQKLFDYTMDKYFG